LTSVLGCQYSSETTGCHRKTPTVVEELVTGQSSGNGNGNRHQGLVNQSSSDDKNCRRSIDTLNVLRGERPCRLVSVLGRHGECWMSRYEGERDKTEMCSKNTRLSKLPSGSGGTADQGRSMVGVGP
jgi:hypothetical protein